MIPGSIGDDYLWHQPYNYTCVDRLRSLLIPSLYDYVSDVYKNCHMINGTKV